MPNIRIVKLKIRRGTEAERKQVVLEQGELGYTTDTKRLFVGNGFTSGGEVVAAKVHEILNSPDSRYLVSTAYQNDLVYENNFLYQLTGTDYSKLSAWSFIGSQVDNESIEYDGNRKLSVKNSGIDSNMIQLTAVTLDKLNQNILYLSGGLTLNPNGGLSANIDPQTLEIINNKITLKSTAISSIASSALSNGLTGGDGAPLSAAIDNSTIIFNSNKEISVGTIDGSNISTGTGLFADPNNNNALTHIITEVDTDFYLDNGFLQMQEKLTYNNTEYVSPNIVVDKSGLIRAIGNNYSLPLSSNTSPFGGFASQLSSTEITTTVTASTGIGAANITLSSAGFMVTRIGTPNITTGDTRNFLNSQYVAIPIFTIPQSVINLAANVVTLIYPYAYEGYRAYDPSQSTGVGIYTGELNTAILTGAACSGRNDASGYAVFYDVYSVDSSLKLGTRLATSTNALTTLEIPTLSGWWAIGTTLYFVNSTNTITVTGKC